MPDIDWKKNLQPFAEHIANMQILLHELPDDELSELIVSCEVPNCSNCWWATFDAAQIIKPMANGEAFRRASLRKEPK